MNLVTNAVQKECRENRIDVLNSYRIGKSPEEYVSIAKNLFS